MGPHNVVSHTKLPPTFTSFYRIFLRATSASVLHHPRSTRSLRRLWRPIFNDAAEVVHRLQTPSQEPAEREKLEIWLKLWDTRMDATLNILYSSSQSRGLPHKLTQNLSTLLRHHLKWTTHHYYYAASSTWKPNLPASSPEYAPTPLTLRSKNFAKKQERKAVFDKNAWGALGEVVRMAEGRHNISLGRATFNERKA